MKKKILAFLCSMVLCMALMAGCGAASSGSAAVVTGTFDGTVKSIKLSKSELTLKLIYEVDGKKQNSEITAIDDSLETEEEMIAFFDECYTLLDADGNEISVADIEEGAAVSVTIGDDGSVESVTLKE